MFKIIAISAIFLLADVNASSIAKREVQPTQSQFLTDMQKNIDQFRICMDQSLANVVGQVNEKQLQPIFSVVGDSLNRVSKAFDDLTATTRPASHNY